MNVSRRLVLSLAAAACLIPVGCATHAYAPPPPYYAPPIVQEADRRGFRAGQDDGARDAANRFGYHPRTDRKYADTPGYDPGMGPFPAYRNAFRNAYLRGYDAGFYRR